MVDKQHEQQKSIIMCTYNDIQKKIWMPGGATLA